MGAPQQVLSAYGAPSDVLWDSTAKGTTITLSNASHDATATTSGFGTVRGAMGKSSGKWYFELYVVAVGSGGNDIFALVSDATTPGGSGLDTFNAANCGGTRGNGFNAATGFTVAGSGGLGTLVAGNTVGVAFDADNKKAWLATNNVYLSSGNPAAGTSPYVTWASAYTIYPATAMANTTSTVRLKTGTALFTPPSGFSVLA